MPHAQRSKAPSNRLDFQNCQRYFLAGSGNGEEAMVLSPEQASTQQGSPGKQIWSNEQFDRPKSVGDTGSDTELQRNPGGVAIPLRFASCFPVSCPSQFTEETTTPEGCR